MIALVLSPIGRWLIAAAISVLLIAGAYLKGRHDEAAIDKGQALRAQVAELQRQLTASRQVAQDAATRADARAKDVEATQQKVRDYEAELARRDAEPVQVVVETRSEPQPAPVAPPDSAAGVCRLGADDVGRLLDILGRRPAKALPAGGQP